MITNDKLFLVYICNFPRENFLTIRYGFPAIFGSPWVTSLHQQNRCLGPLTIADSWSINLLFSTEDAMEVKVQRCEKKISCTYFDFQYNTMMHHSKNVIHMTYFFQFREMLTEMRENKKAKKFTRFVPGARDGRSALEVMDNSFGGKASNLLLGNKGTVTERDKVQINQSTTNFANFCLTCFRYSLRSQNILILL